MWKTNFQDNRYKLIVSIITVIMAIVLSLDYFNVIFKTSNHWLVYLFTYLGLVTLIRSIAKKAPLYMIISFTLFGAMSASIIYVSVKNVQIREIWPTLITGLGAGFIGVGFMAQKIKKYFSLGVIIILISISAFISIRFKKLSYFAALCILVLSLYMLIDRIFKFVRSFQYYKENQNKYVEPSDGIEINPDYIDFKEYNIEDIDL